MEYVQIQYPLSAHETAPNVLFFRLPASICLKTSCVLVAERGTFPIELGSVVLLYLFA